MKIGDYVTVQEIMDQSTCRWVVLTDFVFGELDDIEGGIIRCIEHTKTQAGKIAAKLNLSGTPALIVSGTWETLCVGGVLVE